MKKILSFLFLGALILSGCAQEPLSGKFGKGEVVTFTVGVSDMATRAVADGDGAAAKVNHWVMEVLDSDGERYNYQEDDAEEGVLTHSFDVRLIKGQTYNILFWADTKGTYDVAKLEDVKLAYETAYAANLDSRDAFSAVVSNFQSVQATQQTVTLKRPFAQLNVIFTDLKDLYETMGSDTEYAKYKPTDFVATAKVPTAFNVLTQTAGTPATTALTISAAGDYLDNYDAHAAKATLFMDYFFASASAKDIVDIDFSFVSNGTAISHSFTSVPFQRNYRTNIYGDLMSSNAKWNVVIDPIWDQPDEEVSVFEAKIDNIEALNTVLSSAKAAAADEVIVTTTMPTDSDSKDVVFTTANNDQVVSLTFEGTLGTSKTITFKNDSETTTEGPANLNIVAPAGTKLVFNNPLTHVVINGTSYENISGTFSANSLIIEKGVTVNNLEIAAGGLEIHGTVNNVTVTGTAATVFVRDCEGLSDAVYNVLKDYIAEGYEAKQNGSKWDIIATNWINYAAASFLKEEGKVITINSAEQLALLAKNVLAGNTYAGYTIKLNGNIDLAGKVWTPIGIYSYRRDCADKNTTVTLKKPFNGTFDGNGYTVSNIKIAVADNGKAYNGAGLFGYMTAGTVKNVTVANPDIEGRLYVGAVVGYPSTGTAIENCHVKGDIKVVASWYCGGIAGNGYISSIKGCSVIGNSGSYIKGNAVKYNDDYAGYFGGIIGFSGENSQVVDNCVVKNVEITADCNGLGGIAGILHYGNTVKNCSLENVTLTLNSNEQSDIERLGLYAGGNNGTTSKPGWCINNKATGCTVSSLAGPCATLVGAAGTNMPNPVCIIGEGVEFDNAGKVIAGTFQAIPASVVADKYVIEKVSANLYKVAAANLWTDYAAASFSQIDELGKTITITSAEEFALLAKNVNNGNSYSGYSISLGADIDLAAHNWVTVGNVNNNFCASFDGCSKTISNLKINNTTTANNATTGLFGWINTVTIKDINVNGAKITGHHDVGVIAGYMEALNTCTISGCNVTNAEISCTWGSDDTDGDKCGGIVGYAGNAGSYVTDCTVANTTINAGRDAGQVVGAGKTAQVTGCSATNVSVTANGTGSGANIKNEIIGRAL